MKIADEIKFDFQRAERIGFDEAVLCQGKADEQLAEILGQARARKTSLLLTRLSVAQFDALPSALRKATDYEPLSRTAYFGPLPRKAAPSRTAIVAAGTSDAFVFREIQRVMRFYGHESTLFADVGMAAMWRLMERIEEIRKLPVTIVVAGMDAALITAVGGLVSGVCIGVPTSTGYGVATGGSAALHAGLASCAPGVTLVNIDNGYGAACAAIRALRSK